MWALSLLHLSLGQTGDFLVESNLRRDAASPRYDMNCVNCSELCAWSDHQPGCNGAYATEMGMKRESWADAEGTMKVYPEGSYACIACRSCKQTLYGQPKFWCTL